MNRRHSRGPRSRRADNQSGVAALEFALILPILLMLILGIISVGHGMVVRYVLNSGAYEAARSCAMNRTPTQACAQVVINNTVSASGGAAWCTSIAVNATAAPDPTLTAVTNFTVTANCSYRGIIATGYLSSHGLAILNIRARAVMPY